MYRLPHCLTQTYGDSHERYQSPERLARPPNDQLRQDCPAEPDRLRLRQGCHPDQAGQPRRRCPRQHDARGHPRHVRAGQAQGAGHRQPAGWVCRCLRSGGSLRQDHGPGNGPSDELRDPVPQDTGPDHHRTDRLPSQSPSDGDQGHGHDARSQRGRAPQGHRQGTGRAPEGSLGPVHDQVQGIAGVVPRCR